MSVLLRHLIKKSVSLPKQRASQAFQMYQNSMREYDEKVIDHFTKPRNVGKFDEKEENVGTGLVGAPACGDVMV